MAENSKIEWTHHTFNPWMGCTKVHTGCTHCYAEELMDHRYGKVQWGPNGTRVRTTPANWKKPLAWNRAAEAAGERHRVFCASLADVFEDWSGPVVKPDGTPIPMYEPMDGNSYRNMNMGDMRRDLFKLIDQTPHLDWLLLTKRPENVRKMWPRLTRCENCGSESVILRDDHNGCADCGAISAYHFRPNVWIGTSVSDQNTANTMVPRLLTSRDLCAVLFLSAEPMVGAIDLDPPLCEQHGAEFIEWDDEFGGHICNECAADDGCSEACFGMWLGDLDDRIDWVIVGGESGPGRRPMDPDWARAIRDQCKEEEVAFFMKQIDKVQPIPDDLMIRQFPQPDVAYAT